jgi:outer membrane protein OmpA-like peptidoglycan-associated protein
MTTNCLKNKKEQPMKILKYLVLVAFAGFFVSCAATAIPTELSNARQAYQHASEGPAAQLVPAELHKAKQALDQAEISFEKDPKSYQTKDLAYVAERKAIKADALASIATQKANAARANNDYQTTQGDIIERTQTILARTQTEKAEAASAAQADKLAVQQQALLDSEKRSADAAAAEAAVNLAASQQARMDAEKRADDAQAELAAVAMLKEESRGLVITLSGSVVFASNQTSILPAAQSQLNQVSEALISTDEHRKLTVEGHTDSMGSDVYNMQLSQRRADAVRSYLISRGYPADMIEARGIGEVRPIADNASPEGRSNNRRVEIIVQREPRQ